MKKPRGRPFKKGGPPGPGRPEGVPNKATAEMKAWLEGFLAGEAYRENAKGRVLKGRASHLETLWHHYAYGQPKQEIELTGRHLTKFELTAEPPETPVRE